MPVKDAFVAAEPPPSVRSRGRAERPRERRAREKELVLLLGWGGSSEKHLEPFVQMHRELGRETRVFIFRMVQGLLRFGDERRAFGPEARWLAAAAAGRPVIVHAFSDNGFFALCKILEGLRESPEGRRAIANLRGVICDSGPALYAATREDFSARFANALTPLSLRLLGLPVRQRHAVATPALRACFRLYQAFWADTVRHLIGAYDEVADDYPRCPHLFLYSSNDPVIPRRDVEAFVARQKARDVRVEARCFSTDRHLGTLRADPSGYRRAVAAFCAG